MQNPEQSDAFADDEATAARAAKAIHILTDALDALYAAGSVTRAPDASPRVVPIAYGWLAATLRHAQLVALGHEHGLRHETSSTARVVLQHAMAVQWLIEGGDAAVDALEADGHRRAFDLIKELKDTNWAIPPELTMNPTVRPPKKGALEEQIDNFKAMCQVYDNGQQSYVPFRVQSANTHPSYVGAMAYLVPETGELSAEAVTDSNAYLLDSARCAIQAVKAFAPLFADTTLTTAAQQAEEAFGIPIALWVRRP